jgi:hypothetical protein
MSASDEYYDAAVVYTGADNQKSVFNFTFELWIVTEASWNYAYETPLGPSLAIEISGSATDDVGTSTAKRPPNWVASIDGYNLGFWTSALKLLNWI